jgi:hypothetical protein
MQELQQVLRVGANRRRMILREILKKIRQIELRTNRLVSETPFA